MISTAAKTDEAGILSVASNIEVFSEEEKACVRELWNEYINRGPQASGYYFLVHRGDDRVTGFACYGPHALTSGTYDLYWIGVDPLASRKGVGKDLLAQVELEVRGLGGRMIVLDTSSLAEYAPARAFYMSQGYTQEAVVKDFYRTGDDLVIFTKHL